MSANSTHPTKLESAYALLNCNELPSLQISEVSPSAPRPHVAVVDLFNNIASRLATRALALQQYGNRPTFENLMHRSTTNSAIIGDTRKLLTVISGVTRVQEVLRKPFFVGTTGVDDGFLPFSRECVKTMRADLISKGYTDSSGDEGLEYSGRWSEQSEEAKTASIFRDTLALRLSHQHGIFYDPNKAPLLLKPLARTIHYRRHGWPLMSHVDLAAGTGVNCNEPQELGLLLTITKTQSGLWRVLQNMVIIATILSVESGNEDPRPNKGSSAQRSLREDWTAFAFAACVSPLVLLAPFTVNTDVTSEIPVHQVCGPYPQSSKCKCCRCHLTI